MKRSPRSVTITLVLIALNAAFWLVYAGMMFFESRLFSEISTFGRSLMGILALGASAALAGSAFLLARRVRLGFIFGLGLLAIIAVLSITDEFGWPDLISLLLSLAPLILLLKDRAWYMDQFKPTKNTARRDISG